MSKCYTSDTDYGRKSDIPSWSFWSDGRSEWRRATLGLEEHGPYNASKGFEVDIDLLESTIKSESYELASKGIRIGRICSTTHYPFHRRPLVSEAMHQVYAKIFDPAGTVSSWRHAKNITHLPLLDQGQLPYHYFAHWRDVPRDSLDSSAGQTDPSAPNYLPCHGKCMFSTQENEGLCPNGAQVGDIVVILFGSNVPYILRAGASPGQYFLVGECYIDAVMHGEVFDKGVVPKEEVFLLV
ncbi:hypothetical protein F4815DRAFT_334348 [Daldinia loculata]|nr:hypothetical protein F4815DRAFT_334348 [Daldinia loculata]